MYCYTLVEGIFQAIDDPIGEDSPGQGYAQQLYEAGYLKQLSSHLPESDRSEITLYSTADTGKPKYYIDVTGNVGQMAVLIADDFPHLIATLKEISPLISLVGLSQQTEMHTDLVLAQD